MSEARFSSSRPAQIHRLGRVFYDEGLRMQKAMAGYVKDPTQPGQVLILEHTPVFTLGRNATRRDIHVNDAFLEERGVDVFDTDRGGQVTYHGPGQIVVYPVCNLRQGRADVNSLVWGLEESMIRTAGDFGVSAERLPGFPGIWVQTPRGYEKLGALGIHLQRWISTHGIAFNVEPELAHFRWITPCGITDKGVCSLKSLLGDGSPSWSEAATHLERHLVDVLRFDVQPTPQPNPQVSVLVWRRTPQGPQALLRPQSEVGESSISGVPDRGESLEACAIRSVNQQTGLQGALQPLLVHSLWANAYADEAGGEPRLAEETCFHLEASPDSEAPREGRWSSFEEAASLLQGGSAASLRMLRKRLEA